MTHLTENRQNLIESWPSCRTTSLFGPWRGTVVAQTVFTNGKNQTKPITPIGDLAPKETLRGMLNELLIANPAIGFEFLGQFLEGADFLRYLRNDYLLELLTAIRAEWHRPVYLHTSGFVTHNDVLTSRHVYTADGKPTALDKLVAVASGIALQLPTPTVRRTYFPSYADALPQVWMRNVEVICESCRYQGTPLFFYAALSSEEDVEFVMSLRDLVPSLRRPNAVVPPIYVVGYRTHAGELQFTEADLEAICGRTGWKALL